MIVLTPEAIADTERVHQFLESKNPQAASRAMRAIYNAIKLVEEHPNLGRGTRDPRIRQLPVRFGTVGYVIRYTQRPDGALVVLRIWHGREDR